MDIELNKTINHLYECLLECENFPKMKIPHSLVVVKAIQLYSKLQHSFNSRGSITPTDSGGIHIEWASKNWGIQKPKDRASILIAINIKKQSWWKIKRKRLPELSYIVSYYIENDSHGFECSEEDAINIANKILSNDKFKVN